MLLEMNAAYQSRKSYIRSLLLLSNKKPYQQHHTVYLLG